MTRVLCGATGTDFTVMLDKLHPEFFHLFLQFYFRKSAGLPVLVILPLPILPEGYFIGKGWFIRVNIANISDGYFRCLSLLLLFNYFKVIR